MKGKKIIIGFGIVFNLVAIYLCISYLWNKYTAFRLERRYEPVVVPPMVPPEPKKMRNILFTYKSAKAISVAIIGDFNDWTPEPMERTGSEWRIVKQLLPGEYLYNFVVDGRPITDPYNLRPPRDNERGFLSSVLIVKPLEE